MTVTALMAETARLGIRLEARGNQLHVEAPTGRVTPELRDHLIQLKPALLALLLRPTVVSLQGGLAVPVEALKLALDLEARGVVLRTDSDHRFIVPDDPRLTVLDHVLIARWRSHLGAIVEYSAPVSA